MAAITAAMVKELREKTNAGMMDCKEALKEAKGDMEQAETILRKKGIADAEKKAGRDAKEGVVASRLLKDGSGILVEMNCETDFVANNQSFRDFVEQILDHIEKSEDAEDLDALLAQPYVGDDSQSLGDFIKAKVGELGENMALGRFAKFKASRSRVGEYIHLKGRVGVLTDIAVARKATADNEAFQEFSRNVSMHVAASSPVCVDRKGVPKEKVEAERDIFREQMKGKPAHVIEKIIDGKLGKFYSQTCLLEQAYIKDPDKTIADLVEELQQATGDDKIKIKRFVRFAVGEES